MVVGRRAELARILLAQVQSHGGTDVDQGQGMRNDVVDVPGESQPVLVAGCLFAGLLLAAPLRHPFAAQPDPLPAAPASRGRR